MSAPKNKIFYTEGEKINDCILIKELPTVRYDNDSYTRRGRFICFCGREFEAEISKIRLGKTKSCGCRRQKVFKEMVTKHGMSRSSEYSSWLNMKDRCYNEKNKSYHNYGGRGIVVCARWLHSFENFLEDMGPKPSKDYSLERVDNERGYGTDNCEWANRYTQSRNTRSNKIYEYRGETKILKDWADSSKINYGTLKSRMQSGMTILDALEIPINTNYKKRKDVCIL